MSDADFHKDKSSSQLLGKEFIIVVVVVFSALSFTLGYFVGKSDEGVHTENLSQAREIVAASQSPGPAAPLHQQHILVTQNSPLSEENTEDQAQPRQNEPSVIVEPKGSGPAKSVEAMKEKPGTQSAQQQLPEEDDQKTAAKKSSSSIDSNKAGEPVYTVQLGAFKSSADAKAFRKKQAKNKLKTYITISGNMKKEKTYKVRTGEFRDRKSAELLSLKLNKTEKLKSFVTLKNE